MGLRLFGLTEALSLAKAQARLSGPFPPTESSSRGRELGFQPGVTVVGRPWQL